MADLPEFLIEGILPAGEAHLIGGASGSGKTTWIFHDFLAEWQEGRPVFDHQSYPVPHVYVSLDRSRSSVNRTLQRLGLFEKLTRIICLDEMPDECLELTAVLKFAVGRYPDSRLIIIEGFALMSGEKTNSYTGVGVLMRRAARFCAKHKLTIIGVCHAPKMKADEAFQHSRELLLGSVSWAAYSDTIIVLNLEETSGNITIKVMPRNAPMETHELKFGENGLLVPVIHASKQDTVCFKIASLTEGRPITRTEIRAWGKALNISLRTCDIAIKTCLENKVLETIGEGIYERTRQSLPPTQPENDISIEE